MSYVTLKRTGLFTSSSKDQVNASRRAAGHAGYSIVRRARAVEMTGYAMSLGHL